jgi:hypothetical protein
MESNKLVFRSISVTATGSIITSKNTTFLYISFILPGSLNEQNFISANGNDNGNITMSFVKVNVSGLIIFYKFKHNFVLESPTNCTFARINESASMTLNNCEFTSFFFLFNIKDIIIIRY